MKTFQPRFYHLIIDKILLWSAFLVCLAVQLYAVTIVPDAEGFQEFLKYVNTTFLGGILMLIRHDVKEVREAWKDANGTGEKDDDIIKDVETNRGSVRERIRNAIDPLDSNPSTTR